MTNVDWIEVHQEAVAQAVKFFFQRRIRYLDAHGIQCRTVDGRLQALSVWTEVSSDRTPADIRTEWVDVTDWDSLQLRRWLGY
jgi:predicted glycoside hydrolase/deacetylase ChbG (UPF0249 family)